MRLETLNGPLLLELSYTGTFISFHIYNGVLPHYYGPPRLLIGLHMVLFIQFLHPSPANIFPRDCSYNSPIRYGIRMIR
jgi:hypothetical protein